MSNGFKIKLFSIDDHLRGLSWIQVEMNLLDLHDPHKLMDTACFSLV